MLLKRILETNRGFWVRVTQASSLTRREAFQPATFPAGKMPACQNRQDACVTAFSQKNNRDVFCRRQWRACQQQLIPVQTMPCRGMENFQFSIAEFSDR